jgi:hypothetical protein
MNALVCSQTINTNTVQAINQHNLHHVPSTTLTFDEHLASFKGNRMPFHQQQIIINSLSGDSAPSSKSSVSHVSYFSTGTGDVDCGRITSRYLSTSLRNSYLYFASEKDGRGSEVAVNFCRIVGIDEAKIKQIPTTTSGQQAHLQ